MKKYIALLCALLIVLGLAGCGAETAEVQELKNEVEELKKEIEELKTGETEPNKTGVQYYDFYFELLGRLDEIVDDYKIIESPPTVYNTDGDTSQAFSVEDRLLGETCYIHVDYNKDGGVFRVNVTGDKEDVANFTFAILSIYAYESLGLPEHEDFYEKFNLLEEEPSGYLEVAPNWTASAITIDDLLTFVVSYE